MPNRTKCILLVSVMWLSVPTSSPCEARPARSSSTGQHGDASTTTSQPSMLRKMVYAWQGNVRLGVAGLCASWRCRHAAGHYYAGKNVNCAVNTVRVDGTRWVVVAWGDRAPLDAMDVGYQQDAWGGGRSGG
jgi:hypothetical protein